MKPDSLAPIALFVYNRPSELKRTLQRLAANFLAKDSLLFVFSDGPKSNSSVDKKRVESVRKLIKKERGFKSVHVIESANNIGLANSIIRGVSEILDGFENVIVLEDDLETSPYFLTYMNTSLKHYSSCSKVWTVNSMSLNPNCFSLPENYLFNTYFLYRNNSYGWGTWRAKWRGAVWESDWIASKMSDENCKRFNRAGVDCTQMLRQQLANQIDSWSIRWGFNISLNDGVCLTPRFSYINPIVSASGTHVKSEVLREVNDVSKALPQVDFPLNTEVDKRIAVSFALNFHSEVPILLQ